ncbi:MAG: hypothetical protein NC087_05245 [Anaeroplasma bactoclasticum]|nr:hypothetical protein [Anaeroplasma bactoclasticum]
MSTRSYICKELPNGKYKTIYCHSDGYIDFNGAILNDCYTTEKKVDKLLALGNISSLGVVTKPDKRKTHNFDNPQRYVCVAYGRDRGENKEQSRDLTLKEMFKNTWIEYFYMFDKDGKWQVSQAYFPNEKKLELLSDDSLKNTFKPLAAEVEKECTPEWRAELKKLVENMSSGEEM